MNTAKLNDWLQIIGIFAVVVSLLFVGYQLKQSQDIAIAGQNQARQSVVIDYYSWQGQNDEATELHGARHRDHLNANVSDEDRQSDRLVGLAYIRARMRLSIFDNNHFQFQSGFMTEESWQPYLDMTRSACTDVRDEGIIMQHHGYQFRAGFRELCMKFVNESKQAGK
jgi:hypothetical protein